MPYEECERLGLVPGEKGDRLPVEAEEKPQAEEEALQHAEEVEQAILKVIGHHSAKDMQPLYDVITTVQQDPVIIY